MQLTRTSILRRSAVVLTAAAVAAGGVAISSAADASPTRHLSAARHVEHFTIGGNENHQVVIAHGLITAGGKDVSHDAYDVLKFHRGTLRITHPEKGEKFVPKINAKTCYGSFTISGKYTVGHGTGAYHGVTGKGTYRGVGEVILPRTKSGACSMTADPKFEVFTLKAGGPISR